ncbi:MAG: hypothetical protein ACE5IH_02125 [Thermodesulfobacteriota bacterium]
MRTLFYVTITLLWMTLVCGIEEIRAAGSDQDGGQKVIERVIKIEGTLERPRVIFIVPRSRLWKPDISKKSFIPEILREVYPEVLVKEQRRQD